MKEMKDKKIKGFTVLELLVVVTLLGLLASIILVAIKNAREKGEITANFQHASTVNHLLGSDLVGEWKFDDPANRGKDTSGSGNNASTNACSFVPSFLGQAGDAVQSTGLCSVYINWMENTNPLNLGGGDLTIVAWIRMDSAAVFPPNFIFQYNVADDSFATYFLFRNGNKISMEVGTNPVISGNKTLMLNKWYFVAGTYNTLTQKLTIYVNGQQDVSQAIDGSPSHWAKTSKQGAWMNTSNNSSSTIDDVRVYSKALTVAQVQRLYAKGLERHKELAEK